MSLSQSGIPWLFNLNLHSVPSIYPTLYLFSIALNTIHPTFSYQVYIYVLSYVQLFATPWSVTCQAPLSTEISRQEYRSGLPFPVPGTLPNPGIRPAFLAYPVLAGRFFTTMPPPLCVCTCVCVCVCVCVCMHVLSCFSHVQFFAALWTIACQAPLSMGFPRPEYWSGLPFHPSRDLPDPGIKPASLMSPALAVGLFTTSTTWKTYTYTHTHKCVCIYAFN